MVVGLVNFSLCSRVRIEKNLTGKHVMMIRAHVFHERIDCKSSVAFQKKITMGSLSSPLRSSAAARAAWALRSASHA